MLGQFAHCADSASYTHLDVYKRQVLGRLNRLIGRHVPEFAASTRSQALQRSGPALSAGLARAIDTAQLGIRQRVAPTTLRGAPLVTTPVMLEELHQRKQQLKKAAATPEERATIEIVALLFQSILTEDRIPASVRVWFARLQMPTLRVAVTEPDFFATIDHPARRLIDRMGACVMGFDSAGDSVGDTLEREIKRIVQVVEAYPDTGRRVFQTVLIEFEKFLEHYFKNQNEATKRGVSLAQQVEQRETLAIQYTIELRRMLNEVPVQEGVRQFLFHVWADVLATTAVRFTSHSEQTKQMKDVYKRQVRLCGHRRLHVPVLHAVRRVFHRGPGLQPALPGGGALDVAGHADAARHGRGGARTASQCLAEVHPNPAAPVPPPLSLIHI